MNEDILFRSRVPQRPLSTVRVVGPYSAMHEAPLTLSSVLPAEYPQALRTRAASDAHGFRAGCANLHNSVPAFDNAIP